jgi:hypothetical protein
VSGRGRIGDAGSPLPFAHNGQSRAVDDERDGLVDRDELQVDIEVPATPRESGVIWSFEIVFPGAAFHRISPTSPNLESSRPSLIAWGLSSLPSYTIYRVRPKEPLTSGEYALIFHMTTVPSTGSYQVGSGWGQISDRYYDFGVDD